MADKIGSTGNTGSKPPSRPSKTGKFGEWQVGIGQPANPNTNLRYPYPNSNDPVNHSRSNPTEQLKAIKTSFTSQAEFYTKNTTLHSKEQISANIKAKLIADVIINKSSNSLDIKLMQLLLNDRDIFPDPLSQDDKKIWDTLLSLGSGDVLTKFNKLLKSKDREEGIAFLNNILLKALVTDTDDSKTMCLEVLKEDYILPENKSDPVLAKEVKLDGDKISIEDSDGKLIPLYDAVEINFALRSKDINLIGTDADKAIKAAFDKLKEKEKEKITLEDLLTQIALDKHGITREQLDARSPDFSLNAPTKAAFSRFDKTLESLLSRI